MRTRTPAARPLCVAVCAAALTGCSSAAYDREMEKVAKRWCTTIRASQVIPVYPLTEDIQPGDVFIVDRTTDDQATLYNERGFLPLDKHTARLDTDFDEFYQAQFFAGDYNPGASGKPRLRRTIDSQTVAPFDNAFEVPRASFPSYTVSVDRSTGFKAAFPIQSIPVGLGLLNANNANATVTIADAYTYGADPMEMRKELVDWAAGEGREVIAEYNANRADSSPLFLRLIQRVYLTGGVQVTINTDSRTAAGADVGLAKRIELLSSENATETARLAELRGELTESLNESLKDNALPGASLRYAGSTSTSVTLNETFDRAIVIGYISVDYEITPQGGIGVAYSTQDVIEGRQSYARSRQFGKESVFDLAQQKIVNDYAGLAEGDADEKARAARFVSIAADCFPNRAEEFDKTRRLVKEGKPAGVLVTALDSAIAKYISGQGDGNSPRAKQAFYYLQQASKLESESKPTGL